VVHASAVRKLRKEDIPDVLGLAGLAGWNQVAEDWGLFIDLSPEGAFGMERGGRVVATSTAVAYGRDFGWVGMMLVHPDERRKGLGAKMLEEAISFLLGRGCLPALDATDMGKPLYEKFGFRDLFAVERWAGTAAASPDPDPPCRWLGSAEVDGVLPLDRESFGADRAAVLRGLLGREGTAGFVLERGGEAEGFIAGRPGKNFFHLGPWVSRSPEAAEGLLRATLAAVPGAAVCVDIPAPNEAARSIARAAGLAPARTLWRMVRWGSEAIQGPAAGGIPPGGRPDRVYGLAGFEWG
jgi:[ribosomal protein S18]-alanine N-acetyltransferase